MTRHARRAAITVMVTARRPVFARRGFVNRFPSIFSQRLHSCPLLSCNLKSYGTLSPVLFPFSGSILHSLSFLSLSFILFPSFSFLHSLSFLCPSFSLTRTQTYSFFASTLSELLSTFYNRFNRLLLRKLAVPYENNFDLNI